MFPSKWGMYIMLIIKILKTGLKDKLYSDVYGTLVMQLPVWFCKQDFAIGYWLPIKQVTGRVGVHIMPSWVKVWCSVKQVCLVGCKTRSLGCQQPELLHLTINNQQGTATFRPEVLNFLVFFFKHSPEMIKSHPTPSYFLRLFLTKSIRQPQTSTRHRLVARPRTESQHPRHSKNHKVRSEKGWYGNKTDDFPGIWWE